MPSSRRWTRTLASPFRGSLFPIRFSRQYSRARLAASRIQTPFNGHFGGSTSKSAQRARRSRPDQPHGQSDRTTYALHRQAINQPHDAAVRDTVESTKCKEEEEVTSRYKQDGQTNKSLTSTLRDQELRQVWKRYLKDIFANHRHPLSEKARKLPISRAEIQSAVPGYLLFAKGRLKRRYLRKSLSAMIVEGKEEHVQAILLLAISNNPASAFGILCDLLKGSTFSVPAHVVRDVLLAVAHIFAVKSRRLPSGIDSQCRENLTTRTLAMVGTAVRSWSRHFPDMISHDLVCLLSARLRSHELTRLFNLVNESSCKLETRTLCAFINRYLCIGNHRRSLLLLKTIPEAERSRTCVQKACIGLLTRDFLRSKSRLFRLRVSLAQHILRLGVRPDSPLRNTIIRAAAEAGEHDLARDIFRAAMSGSTTNKPDTGAIRALLCGSAIQIREIHWILDQAEEYNLMDASIANLAISAVDRFQRRFARRGGRPLDEAFTVYARFFNMDPLIDLGLLPSDPTSSVRQTDCLQFKPRPSTIATLIRAYCEQFSGTTRLWFAYQRYMHHARSGHRIFRVCALQPYVSEFFMLGMRDNHALLDHCTQILLDMLDTGTASIVGKDRDFGRAELSVGRYQILEQISHAAERNQFDALRQSPSKRICPPRTLTWSILLSAAFNAGEKGMVDKVMSLLQELKVPLATVVWNTLLSRYARDQNIDEVVAIIKNMDASGEEADAFTERALSKIHDRGALITALDQAVQRRKGKYIGAATDTDLSASFADDLEEDDFELMRPRPAEYAVTDTAHITAKASMYAW